MDRDDVERRILARGWLSQQSPAFQERLLASARDCAHGAGEALFHAGDDAGGAYGVMSGGIGISVPLDNGSMALAHVARAGTWFGHGPLFTRQPRILSFAATEPSRTLHVPLADLDAIAAEGPLHARGVGAIADFGAVVAIMVSRDLLIRSGPRRIAATLLRVTTGSDGITPEDPDGFHLTQAQLGEMANASRSSTGRSPGSTGRGSSRSAMAGSSSATPGASPPSRAAASEPCPTATRRGSPPANACRRRQNWMLTCVRWRSLSSLTTSTFAAPPLPSGSNQTIPVFLS